MANIKIVFPLLFFFILLSNSISLFAQTEQKENKRHLYSLGERQYKTKQRFEPLDGAVVKIIPFRVDKLFGFLDKESKKEIIKPRYTKVWAVSETGAIVEDEKNYIHFIDNNGKANGIGLPEGELSFEKYGSLTSFHCSDANPYNSKGSAVCLYFGNRNFDLVFQETVHDYKPFLGDDTLAWFRYGEDIRIRNLKGDTMRTMKYDSKNTFMGICRNLLVFRHYTSAKDTMYYSAFDLDMNLVFKVPVHSPSLRGPYRISERIYGFNNSDGELFFADEGGILNYGIMAENIGFDYYQEGFNYQRYYSISDFTTGKYGVCDSDARVQIQLVYDYIGPYRNGFMQYRDSTGIGFMTLEEKKIPTYIGQGEYLLTLNYLGVSWQFSENLLLLPPAHFKIDYYDEVELGRIEKKAREPFRFLDTNGKVAITLTKDYLLVGNFYEGLASVVTRDRKLGFINTQGEEAIPAQYEIGEIDDENVSLFLPTFVNGYAYLVSQQGYIDSKGRTYFDNGVKEVIKKTTAPQKKKETELGEADLNAPILTPIIAPPKRIK